MRLGERCRAAAELLEEALDRALVRVAQPPRREPEERADRDIEEAAAGVAREAGEEVGPEHRGDRGAVAAARLACDPAKATRVVALIHERDDLVAEVGVVPTAAVGINELRAADGRPGVDEDDPGVDVLPVEQLEERGPERGAVPPHLELPGEALKHVHGRATRVSLRRVDPQRPLVRVAEWVPAQRLAHDHVLVEPAGHPPDSLSSKRASSPGAHCDRQACIGSTARWRFRTPCADRPRSSPSSRHLQPRLRAPTTSSVSRPSSAARSATISRSPERNTSPGPQGSKADTRTSWPDPTARETVLSGPIRNRSHPCLALVTRVTRA